MTQQPLVSEGVALIAAERLRQIEVEGWTPEHDDKHARGELVWAARAYAARYTMPASMNGRGACEMAGWPWDEGWFKIDDEPIRNLVKAGALIAAEIDRLTRSSL